MLFIAVAKSVAVVLSYCHRFSAFLKFFSPQPTPLTCQGYLLDEKSAVSVLYNKNSGATNIFNFVWRQSNSTRNGNDGGMFGFFCGATVSFGVYVLNELWGSTHEIKILSHKVEVLEAAQVAQGKENTDSLKPLEVKIPPCEVPEKTLSVVGEKAPVNSVSNSNIGKILVDTETKPKSNTTLVKKDENGVVVGLQLYPCKLPEVDPNHEQVIKPGKEKK